MLGERLRVSRERKDYSRRDLSELSGIDQTTIYKIETDKIKNPNLNTIESLAQALETDVLYLLGASDDPTKKEQKPDSIRIDRPLKVEQVKKILKEFQEVTDKLENVKKTKSPRSRPYYPLYIDIPADGGDLLLEELPTSLIKGHINLEYHEQVDYVMRIDGSSMEPFVEENGLVLVRAYEPGLVRDGDIGFFYLKEKKIAAVRQVFYHKIGTAMHVGLSSFNPRKTEWFENSPEILVFQGKVVGSESSAEEVKKILAGLE
jgi:transcriptional regulator with XRE-family HTH domain